jgi:hypothetical protein
MLSQEMAQRIEQWKLSQLTPYPKNPRRHSESQIAQIAGSIHAFGFKRADALKLGLEWRRGYPRSLQRNREAYLSPGSTKESPNILVYNCFDGSVRQPAPKAQLSKDP